MRLPMFVALALVVTTGCQRTRIPPTDAEPTDEPAGPGLPCTDTDDCLVGLVCGQDQTCRSEGTLGTSPLGSACDDTIQCAAGLVCAADGTCRVPGGEGTSGIGASCAGEADCQTGLDCYQEVCTGFELPLIDRPDCPDDGTWGTPENPYRVLFRPETGGQDVYAAPFPADWRLAGESPVLAGHFTWSGQAGLGDVAEDVLADFRAEMGGFGPNATTFARLSDLPAGARIGLPIPYEGDADDPVNEGRGSVAVLDLTEGPDFGQLVGAGWRLRTHQPYLCDPWMAMYPTPGRAYEPGHTYAMLATRDLLGAEGEVPASEPAFDALLGETAPVDPVLQTAWESFAPVRDWLETEGVPAQHLAGGTVFTIEDYDEVPSAVRAVAHTADAPVASPLVLCDDAPGPLADAGDPRRGCFGAETFFAEFQGRLPVPLVQQGSAPFATRADGGNADWSDGGPAIEAFGELAFSLTVPRGTPPAQGWPVVLFGPDADEDYRTAITEGLANRWSSIPGESGEAGFAVLSIDTWLTGPRAGQTSPGWLERFPAGAEEALLYDNPLNPVAVRDNVTQSAMDWFTVIRWLQEAEPALDAVAPSLDVQLDPSRLWLVGQGTGGRALPLVAVAEPDVEAVVLAGTGGLWMDGLAERTEPFALDALLAPALGAPTIDRFQPIVALGQQIVDRTDPVVHAPWVHRRSLDTRDVLLVVAEDPHVGWSSQHALARALHVEQVVQDGAPTLASVASAVEPVSANVSGSTAVAVVNVGTEPHRLLYTNPRTMAQVDGFMATGALTGRATLPALP